MNEQFKTQSNECKRVHLQLWHYLLFYYTKLEKI